ncbi:TIGR00730 family Rossman fold protein [Corynebacterium sp. MSK044]|uniref:LOG family protein n=1 Tax=Corynebacterium sp. MSK044 TaxID=3050195 RepID=UPI002551487C|nr:TIGR00730 family Rossman fold protein [Corynebacterium sp. MSK044]MDK8798322.1 TIGR00730 family Rossman fold protein [Corynebacterium sp. MSK044]
MSTAEATPPSPIHAVTVFAGAREATAPEMNTLARDFGVALARRGITLVYGGSRLGLMGAVAQGAIDAGGATVGIIPEHLAAHEIAHTGLTELVFVDTLAQRKALMSQRCDAFVALPGGAGTLDELFDEWTNQQLALHTKPIGLLGTEFWQPLIQMVDHMVAHGFVRQEDRDSLIVVDDPDELLDQLAQWRPQRPRWCPAPQSAEQDKD